MTTDHFETLYRNFLLPVSLGGRKLGFHASGSLNRKAFKERDPTLHFPLHRRLYNVLFPGGAIVHVVYITLLLYAVYCSATKVLGRFADLADLTATCVPLTSIATVGGRNTFHTMFSNAISSTEGQKRCVTLLQIQVRLLLTHTFWPPLLWYFYLTSCLVPIRYAIHGQKERPREDLLARDKKTGVAYPTKKAMRTNLTWWSVNVEHHRAVMLLYTVLVLGGSFWLL